MKLACRWIAATLLLVLVTSRPGWAWSDAGHKIIAAIAWRQLHDSQRDKILELLSHHPRFAEDFHGYLPEALTDPVDQREWTFQQAAIWPDIARGLPEAEKERFHHSTWHYINFPLYLTPADREHGAAALKLNVQVQTPRASDETMNIVQTIRLARRELQQRHHPRAEQALWLTWLFHTVGDLHQPLHSTTMINVERLPEGDRGGNAISTSQRGNLHALWDGFPGGRIQLAESRSRALKWLNDAELHAEAAPSVRELNEEIWWQESRKLSETVVYDSEVRTFLKQLPAEPVGEKGVKLTLTEDYLERGGHVSRVRVLTAGLRLGAVLNELFER